MADANRKTSPIHGITFIERPLRAKGERWKLGDNEIAYEKLSDCDMYAGTAAALISAGIIEEHMLPGQPNRGKRTAIILTPDGKKQGREYIEITLKNSRLFEVKVGVSEQESARRQAARERLLEADKAAKKLQAARQREALELSELPRSHEQYRNGCVKTLEAHLNIVRDTAIAANKYSGFYFDANALHAFDKAAKELVKTLVQGHTRFNPAIQERRIIEIKSQSSKADMPLQNFLMNVMAQKNQRPEAGADDAQQALPDED
jgi:predicted DNA binding CopG/RHH family protein